MTFTERLKALTPTPTDAAVFLVMVLVSVALGAGCDKLLTRDGAEELLRVQAQAYCAVSAFKPQGLATMYADMLIGPSPGRTSPASAEATPFMVAPLHLTPQDRAMVASGALDIKPDRAPLSGASDCPELGGQRLTALDVGAGMRSVRAWSRPPPAAGLVEVPSPPRVNVMDIPFTFGSLVRRLVTTGPAIQRIVFLLQLLLGFSLTAMCVGLVAGDGFAAQPLLVKAIAFSLGVVALGSLGAWLVQAGMQVGLFAFGHVVRFALLAGGFHTLAFGGYFFSVKAAELRGHHLMEHQVERGVEHVAEWLQRLIGR